MRQDKSPSPVPPPRPNGFALGGATLAAPPSSARPRRRLFPVLSLGLLLLLIILVGIAFVIGTRFTQSLRFENRELSFFQGVRIIGDSLLGTGHALTGESTGRVNILLLGRAGEKYPGRNLTDTVMLLSLDMKKKRVGLLSLPRDLFAPIPNTGLSTKLNALYQIGLNEGTDTEILRSSISTITGQPIHYYAMVDFDGFERMIDALGGIQVEVMRDIYDSRYPGKNYSYETFELKKGWQKLDGQTALKYARERHDDPDGDFGRTKRQQQIMQAVRDRAWSVPTFLNPFTLSGFLEGLGESIVTNIPPEELGRFIELARSFDTRNISTVMIDAWRKESLLRVSHIDVNGVRAFILVPRSGTWDEIHDISTHLFEERQREERHAAMAREATRVLILTTPRYRRNAEALAADIRDTFPVASIEMRNDTTVDTDGEVAMIRSSGPLRSPFTLDSLRIRYGLTVGETTLETVAQVSEGTLVISYRREESLDLSTLDQKDVPTDDQDFQEPLTPQKNLFVR